MIIKSKLGPFILAAIFILGCRVRTQDFLSPEVPWIFRACPTQEIEEPAMHSFDGMISSLADNNWVVDEMSREQLLLKARVCRFDKGNSGDFLKRPAKECLLLVFSFDETGDIRAHNPMDRRFDHKRVHEISEWVRALERTYSELRCYSQEELSRRNATKQNAGK